MEAGVFKATGDLDEADYDAHMDANLKSVWMCLKHELAAMVRQGAGAIVNTSSVNGLGGVPLNALYATAKAGVLALTKSAALEYARQGIRVNALVAGAFRTPMLESVMSRLSPDDLAAAETQYAGLVPLGRIGRPEEAAAAVLWLCSDEATYVTGHSMIVDGGLTAPYR
jgi:NAD(P)-dependent dehydrogenase (short-subunit alcohol dehydrogenase family)